MELSNNYSELTDTQLLHEINEAKKWHEAIKKEIFDLTTEIEEKENVVNEKLTFLENIEKKYVDLMKEITNRQ